MDILNLTPLKESYLLRTGETLRLRPDRTTYPISFTVKPRQKPGFPAYEAMIAYVDDRNHFICWSIPIRVIFSCAFHHFGLYITVGYDFNAMWVEVHKPAPDHPLHRVVLGEPRAR